MTAPHDPPDWVDPARLDNLWNRAYCSTMQAPESPRSTQALQDVAASVGHDFACSTQLESIGPRLNATGGRPVESKLVLYSDRTTEIGIWEVTPGSFPAWKDDVCELMQFVAGRGSITDSSGTTEVRPGVVMFTPDGWTGTWDVHETIRKTYVVHRTKPRLYHILRVASRRLSAKLGRS